jgi:hypothetical protein
MLRRIFAVMPILSSLLCAATIVLWVRSQTTHDRLTHYGHAYARTIESDAGRIIVSREDNSDAEQIRAYTLRLVADHRDLAYILQDPAIAHELRKADPHWEREAVPAWGSAASFRPPPSRIGFGVAHGMSFGDWARGGRWFIVPHWAVVLLTAALPMVFLARFAQRLRRNRRGFCPVCGYDLRASKDRCPECGTPIAKSRRRRQLLVQFRGTELTFFLPIGDGRMGRGLRAAGVAVLMMMGPGCIYIPLQETPQPDLDPRTVCGDGRPIHVGVARERVHEILRTAPANVCTSPRSPFVRETYDISNWVDYFYLFADSPMGSKRMLKVYQVVVEYSDGERVSDCRLRAE